MHQHTHALEENISNNSFYLPISLEYYQVMQVYIHLTKFLVFHYINLSVFQGILKLSYEKNKRTILTYQWENRYNNVTLRSGMSREANYLLEWIGEQ